MILSPDISMCSDQDYIIDKKIILVTSVSSPVAAGRK